MSGDVTNDELIGILADGQLCGPDRCSSRVPNACTCALAAARMKEALGKLDEYEHRAKLHMDRCQHDMERIVALEQQNEALASRLGAVEDELRHSVSVMSIVRSWLLENVRGSTHWENCEREHATCRAISQLGGVVERLSRLNLTAGGVETPVTNEETQ